MSLALTIKKNGEMNQNAKFIRILKHFVCFSRQIVTVSAVKKELQFFFAVTACACRVFATECQEKGGVGIMCSVVLLALES